MELARIVALRPVPCAGLLVAVTRRCPLSCAHCSTSSTMAGERNADGALLRFLRTLSAQQRPDVVLFTGGEPLLRPRLTARLADAAHSAGSAAALLTGAFFARDGRIPGPVRHAITAMDHVSVSLDAFHEREVPRAEVFTLLRFLLDRGIAASLHLVGSGDGDPYLAEVTAQVRAVFGGQVPMLVSSLQPVGRAAGWSAAAARASAGGGAVSPCAMAAWPVVAFDGTVTGCCNQDVVDGRGLPEHLRLGHIETDDWAAIRDRSLSSPMLRMVRTVGPQYMRAHYTDHPEDGAGSPGYCGTCRALSARSIAAQPLRSAAGAAGELLDRQAARLQAEAGPVDFVRRHGCARYADLVALPGRSRAAAAGGGDLRALP